MKHILFSIGLLGAAISQQTFAQIFADVETSMGDFTIELEHEKAPQTVANFIMLAEGSRPWVDSTTGKVKQEPYYNGIIFHRVIAGFMSQTGSQKGDGTDGPGYNFKDELDNGLTHSGPYIVSMANSGPHTNGSQFFITAASQSQLNGIHTVFGEVTLDTPPEGRLVCNAINTVETIDPPDNNKPVVDVVINSITIRRKGSSAENFDEFAQGVPEILAPEVQVEHNSSTSSLEFAQGAHSLSKVYFSSDLSTWEQSILDPTGVPVPYQRYLDANATPLTSFDIAELTEGQPRQFFSAFTISYPADVIWPQDMAGRTLTTLSQAGTIEYMFDGNGGGTVNWLSGGSSGTITNYFNIPDGYGSTLWVFTDIFYPFRYRLGHDNDIPLLISGRHSGTVFNPSSSSISGTFTLTR